MQWTITRHRQRIQQLAEALPDYPLAQDATVTQVIANVPELILAPLEFEFAPEIRKPNQHYLGLCMREHRQDTELDPVFEQAWETIVAQKQDEKRLIYCSFGTFHEGANATLLRFVTNLLEVVNELPNVHLVCSVNKYVIETLRARKLLTDRTHFLAECRNCGYWPPPMCLSPTRGLGLSRRAFTTAYRCWPTPRPAL